MSILNALTNLFSGRSYGSLSPEQEKAFVDALAYAVAIDRDVSQTEEQELTKQLGHLDWKSGVPLDSYVHESIERAKQKTATAADAATYCRDINERLGEDWLREEAYYLSARIAASDSDIVSEEQALLSTMVEAFALDDKVQERITNQLIREMDF